MHWNIGVRVQQIYPLIWVVEVHLASSMVGLVSP